MSPADGLCSTLHSQAKQGFGEGGGGGELCLQSHVFAERDTSRVGGAVGKSSWGVRVLERVAVLHHTVWSNCQFVYCFIVHSSCMSILFCLNNLQVYGLSLQHQSVVVGKDRVG